MARQFRQGDACGLRICVCSFNLPIKWTDTTSSCGSGDDNGTFYLSQRIRVLGSEVLLYIPDSAPKNKKVAFLRLEERSAFPSPILHLAIRAADRVTADGDDE